METKPEAKTFSINKDYFIFTFSIKYKITEQRKK